MAETDTSIYKLAQPTDQNPFAMVGQAANALNAVNQNKLFQASFAARQAIGDAYAKATDPNTGALDTNKLMGLVSQDPRAAFMAGDVAQQSLAREGGQLDVARKKYDQVQAIMAAAAPLAKTVRDGGHVSRSDFIDAAMPLANSEALGPGGAQTIAKFFTTLPSDQNALDKLATDLHLRSLTASQQHEAIYGSPQAIGTGGQTNVVQVPTMGGAPRVAGTLTNTLSPGEASQPTRIFDPATNTFRDVTRNQFLQMSGQQGAPPPQAPAGGLNAVAAPNAAPAATAVPAASARAPGVQALPKLGAETAANVAGNENAQQGVALQRTADTVPARKAILGEMESALGDFTSGPSNIVWKNVLGTVNSLWPYGGMGIERVASNEEFNKLATQLAQQQFATLGGTGTDAKLDSAMHTSPNEYLSNLGNQRIMQLLKGNEDAIAVKNGEWQKWQQAGKGGPESYGQFSTEFNKTFDPRIFQMQYMAPSEKQAVMKGMTAAEQSKFRDNLRTALQLGWVHGGGAQ